MRSLRPKHLLRCLPLLAAGLLLTSCGGEDVPQNVVARSLYGDTTVAELEAYILSLPENQRQPADDQELSDWRRELLEEMLVARRLEEEAREADLLATEEGERLFRRRWEPLVEAHVSDHRIATTVAVTDEELRRFYDEHPEEFSHGEQRRVRHIYKRVARDAPAAEREAAREAIEDIHRRLQEGANFLELARGESDSETAALDGLIGRLDRGALGPEIDDIVWGLDEGEISGVVATPVGFHVFRVENHIEPFHMEFNEARSRLIRRFQREETEATLDAYFDELIEASGAVYNPEGLDGDDDTVLFSLGDAELRRGEFFDRLLTLSFDEQRSKSLVEHLRSSVTQELYKWEAERLGLEDEPEMVARREQVEQRALIDLAYRARREAYLEQLDDALLEEYYEENAARFQTPPLMKGWLLVRNFEGEEGPEWYRLYEEMDELAEGIRSGRLDFTEAAERWSEDISAVRGGDIGWVRPGVVGDWAGPRASKAVLDLQFGEVSEPILIERYDENQMLYERQGYLLMRVDEMRPPGAQEFEDIRDRVAEHYVSTGSEELQARIRRDVLAEIEAEIFEDHL